MIVWTDSLGIFGPCFSVRALCTGAMLTLSRARVVSSVRVL